MKQTTLILIAAFLLGGCASLDNAIVGGYNKAQEVKNRAQDYSETLREDLEKDAQETDEANEGLDLLRNETVEGVVIDRVNVFNAMLCKLKAQGFTSDTWVCQDQE